MYTMPRPRLYPEEWKNNRESRARPRKASRSPTKPGNSQQASSTTRLTSGLFIKTRELPVDPIGPNRSVGDGFPCVLSTYKTHSKMQRRITEPRPPARAQGPWGKGTRGKLGRATHGGDCPHGSQTIVPIRPPQVTSRVFVYDLRLRFTSYTL